MICLLLILMSARPGGLETFLPDKFLLVFVGCPCLVVVGLCALVPLVVLGWRLGHPMHGPGMFRAFDRTARTRYTHQVLIVLLVGLIALTSIPLRIATLPFRQSFANAVATPPPIGRFSGSLGPWTFEQAEVDARGGVYYVTGERSDLIDGYYFGFAYQPNKQGSPFGNAYYRLTPLWGDWYAFRANSDW